MKKQLLIIVALFTFSLGTCLAQDEEESKNKHKGTYNDFNIDLGINNFLEDSKFPSDNNAPYSVKPWGSWYIALKSTNHTKVGGPLYLLWGGDISFYNFKFDNEDMRMTETDNGVVFSEAGDIHSKKSKLTAAYVNASLVPMLKFGNTESHHHRHCHWDMWDESAGFRIGAGVYAGYKIGSYTKVVTEEDGDKHKDRNHDAFYLNNVRYGMRVQAGFRGVDVFFNYDMNELFADNKGPKLNAFSFGVVL
ncbi:hypothetical protein [Fulvivirga ligni]|uniref:hypothetical protein n=1 Tax=Fulvivirga ligni TaxID=2904246 RepID=UPI001F3DB386|nr:hypothetical protein [Fulvivirga ligni]UII20206.1 hypothetical protein LVD16_20375 [Fulvivirga ligni]